MVQFHGDLLLGGAALRNVDGSMAIEDWSGHFSVDRETNPLLEKGRTYLLMLDDGRCGQVILTDMESEDANRLRVVFRGLK